MIDPSEETIEAVAQAIADEDWLAAFDTRGDQRTCSGADGKYRDVNQPSKDDYREAARAAYTAVLASLHARGMVVIEREPSTATCDAIRDQLDNGACCCPYCLHAAMIAPANPPLRAKPCPE